MNQQQQPQQTPNIDNRSKPCETEIKVVGPGEKVRYQGDDTTKAAMDNKGNVATAKNPQSKGKWQQRETIKTFYSSGWRKMNCKLPFKQKQ